MNPKLATLKFHSAEIEPLWATPEIFLFLRMRFSNIFLTYMVWKYQNEIAPIPCCRPPFQIRCSESINNTHRGQFLRVCYRTWFVLYSKFTENDKYNETVLAPNQLNLKVHRISNIYLKASPSGVPFIMCSAQNSGAWTPFSRKSLIPWWISFKYNNLILVIF